MIHFHPSSSSSSVPFSRDEEKKEETKEEQKREELIDWGVLLATIEIELAEKSWDEECSEVAERIGINDCMSSLTAYSYQEVISNLQNVNENLSEEVRQTVLQLYVISLTNGRFGSVALQLEKNIYTYKKQIQKQNLNQLIRKATQSLKQEGNHLLRMNVEIDVVLNLFCYLDSSYKDPLSLLIANSNFPACKKYFNGFIQDLSICQHERTQLIVLKKQIFQKLQQSQPQSSKPQVVNGREVFLRNHYDSFWNSGIGIIEKAFEQTFKAARENKKIILTKELKTALRNAAKLDPKWSRYTLSYLLKNPEAIPEKGFTNSSWSEFGGNDPEELMQKYLDSLPKEWFDEFSAAVEQAADKEKTITDQFMKDLGKPLNIFSLKEWCRNSIKDPSAQ